MTKAELLDELGKLEHVDPEYGHEGADSLLLDYIDDTEITEAFTRLERWYA